MTTDLLKTGDVASMLGVSRQHVVDMCDRGEIACTFVGKHRRVPRSEVDRLRSPRLTREQEKSLWLHRAILTPLLTEPEKTLATALKNITTWKRTQRWDGMTVRHLDTWEKIVRSGLDPVIETVTSPAPEACELRQNSPFAGTLPDDVRVKVLRSFNEHWRREHGGEGGTVL